MENTVENNRLIAEFMGYKITGSDQDFTFFEHPDGKGIIIQSDYDFEKFNSHPMLEARSMIFHRDWNWLMEVIKEIADKTGFQLTLGEDYSYWNNQGENPFTIDYGGYNNINSVYEAVVDLIKWHNSNK